MSKILHIKNMVCPRCVQSVEGILKEMDLTFDSIQLGEVVLKKDLKLNLTNILKDKLHEKGFELLEDKKAKIVEKVKNLIFQLIDQYEDHKLSKMSDYLSREIGYDYSHISGIFTENQGMTIERFMIVQKIERAKALLTYNELNLNEIANTLHYSSSAALSSQFKEITGFTPTEFKKLKEPDRKSLDGVS